MNTKYENLSFDDKIFDFNINRLTNQIWKLIPMKENQENWKGQLDGVLLELAGLGELFAASSKFLVLMTKLEGLGADDWAFDLYRKTVFECISLLREIRL